MTVIKFLFLQLQESYYLLPSLLIIGTFLYNTHISFLLFFNEFYYSGISSLLMNLTLQPSDIKTNASFELIKETLSFSWKIQKKLKIIGPMKAVLYVELEGCNDANIFAGVRKFQNENHIPFEGSYGFGGDMVTKGWLKASLRNLSPDLSTPWESQHIFDKQELLKPKQIVCLEISLLPSATLFHKDDILRLDIQGEWFYNVTCQIKLPNLCHVILPVFL